MRSSQKSRRARTWGAGAPRVRSQARARLARICSRLTAPRFAAWIALLEQVVTRQELERIAHEVEGISSVTSVAGYEILTEGRGSNAGTLIINLEDWSERSMTASQIIEELEERTAEMTDIKLEFFEPPAIPGFGAAGGIALRVLDETQSSTPDYERLGTITNEFIDAVRERPEVGTVFTFYASDYPQYELVIDNDVAMQKGVSIEAALDRKSVV